MLTRAWWLRLPNFYVLIKIDDYQFGRSHSSVLISNIVNNLEAINLFTWPPQFYTPKNTLITFCSPSNGWQESEQIFASSIGIDIKAMLVIGVRLGGPEVWFDTQGTQWKVSHLSTEHFPQVASDKCLHTHTLTRPSTGSKQFVFEYMLHKFLTWLLWSVSSAADRLQITKKEIREAPQRQRQPAKHHDETYLICKYTIKSRTALAHTHSVSHLRWIRCSN